MSKPANERRGEVALPEAGEGAFIRFTVDSLARLEKEYGEDYFEKVLTGLSKARWPVFMKCVEVSVKEMKAIPPFGLPLEELQARLVDGLYLTVHGRTFEEQQEHENKLFQKRLQEAQSQPRVAAAISSMLSDEQATAQD